MEEVTESSSIPKIREDICSVLEGMDATKAEEEEEEEVGELSAKLQQLLQHLQGKAEGWAEAGQSLGIRKIWVQGERKHIRISYWLFDTASNSYDEFFWQECWMMSTLGARAKLRLLRAIGSCMILREVVVRYLTDNDLEALLTPLQLNPILESLDIKTLNEEDHDEYVERICAILGRILRTSRTLMSLKLVLWALSAKGAYHLASGLRGNTESALEELHLDQWQMSSVVKQVAEIVLSAPRLRELRLLEIRVPGDEEDDCVDALASALAQSSSLKALWFSSVERGALALLLKALRGEGSNQSISSLGLGAVKAGIGDSLLLLLSSHLALKELVWGAFEEGLSSDHWRSLGQSFSWSSSLEIFRIQLHWSSFCGQAIDGVEALLSAVDMKKPWKKPFVGLYLNSLLSYSEFPEGSPWYSSFEWMQDGEAEELLSENKEKKSICELHFYHYHNDRDLWTNLAKVLSSKVPLLSSLYLQMRLIWGGEGREVENFLEALRGNSFLRLLTIHEGRGNLWPRGWKQLINCLRFNTSITHLRLIDCRDLDEDAFKQFMGVLRVNLTLKRIRLKGTSWETDGKKELIQEALRRNAAQDSYFSVFRSQGLQFQPARNGRLFLCGSPNVGKTRLRRTMTRILGSSWLGDKASQLLRTKGEEVELLRDDLEMQIAVWDLAGQWIFRTLQDIVFPRTDHTSVFLFVFSPYDRENCCIKRDLDRCFKMELEEWLRFIASNSQITGGLLPKVLVVISHLDKMEYRDVAWAKSIITELREEFQSILDIGRSENLYQVDARRKRDVTPLKHFNFEVFRDLLQDRTPFAPKVCTQMSSVLAKRTKDIKGRPVWPSKEFYRFCFNRLEDDIVIRSLNPETSSGLEVFMAMASHLHDTGSIIVIPSLDRIIVDPNCLTNIFLGELIAMGQNFQMNDSASQRPEVIPLSSRTGFVSSYELRSLLSSFLGKHQFRDLDHSVLEDLLIHFDLCYKLEGEHVSTRYYMPTIMCEDVSFRGLDNGRRTGTGRESLSWSSLPQSEQEFIGFRVQCENPRIMSMTAALYPRFQVYIRHKLITEMNLTDDDLVCSRNYMHLHFDGHEIFVERSDMAKSHIDLMAKCSKNKSRKIAVKYIEHIIDELWRFCASPKGCPGVALVVGILQTKCVEKLVPLQYRGDHQAILIQKLKENFENYIMKQVAEMNPESWTADSSSLLNYEHPWPPVPGYLPRNFELAHKLLSESEVESVTKKVLENHEQQLKLLDQASEEMSVEMGQDETALNLKVVVEVSSSGIDPEVGGSCSPTNCPSLSDHASEPNFRLVLSRISHLEQKIDRLDLKIEGRFDGLEATLNRIEKNMNKVITLQQQLQSSVNNFMCKVDKMIGYADLWERSRTPKRPYLSVENISIFHRVTAAVRLGTPVRLHLMCESSAGPHIVKDQRGLELCLEKENVEWLRCISHVSTRMLYFLVKAGLHVSLGLGQAVPELDSLEAAVPLSIASAVVENIQTDTVSLGKSRNMTMNEAWSRLRSSLEPHLRDKYSELFKLYRVKYLNFEEGGYAWVCDECMTKGIRNVSLECF